MRAAIAGHKVAVVLDTKAGTVDVGPRSFKFGVLCHRYCVSSTCATIPFPVASIVPVSQHVYACNLNHHAYSNQCLTHIPLASYERNPESRAVPMVAMLLHCCHILSRPVNGFRTDHVFGFDAKQADIYNRCARGIVDSCLEGEATTLPRCLSCLRVVLHQDFGRFSLYFTTTHSRLTRCAAPASVCPTTQTGYNGTIFAYGQTGTGKTFTMEGERDPPELQGIIPNSFAHVFGTIRDADADTRFLVRCSYLEIYCEECYDLLAKDTKKKLKLREHPDKGVYVDGLSPWVVQNVEQLDEVMARGNRSRSTAKTNMNDRSSRSHAIFILTIERSDKLPDGKSSFRLGRLNLVDLAGSEKQKKTLSEGQALIEAAKINLSLTMLGNVIASLVDGSPHIPYRDSTLTRLLKDSLGGNSKTTMIANFGPASYNVDETVSTLRYADRAKRIKNTPKINEDPKDAMLREMQERIEALRRQLEEEGGGDSSGSGDSSGGDDEDEQGGGVGGEGKRGRRHRRKGEPKRLSPTKLRAIQDQIAKEKEALQSEKMQTQAERDAAAQALAIREEAFLAAQREREQLEEHMRAMQSKLIVGGVNLLDKAAEQERLLQQSARDLEEADRAAAGLADDIKAAEAEHFSLTEKYARSEHNTLYAPRLCKDDVTWIVRLQAVSMSVSVMRLYVCLSVCGCVGSVDV